MVDVSNNRVVSASQLRAADPRPDALIAKATEGTSFKDATLSSHRAAAKSAKMPFGSYLFLHAASKGDEAAYYLAYAKPKKGDLQPVIDAEEGGLDGRPAVDLAARVHSCAAELERHGYEPILYSDVSTWKQLVAAVPALKRLRVWEAQYPVRGLARWFPRLARLRVRLLHGVTVVMWQFTDSYEVGGAHYDASRLFVPVADLLV